MAKGLKTTSFEDRIKAVHSKASSGSLGLHEQMLSLAFLLKDAGCEPERAIDLMHLASDDVQRRKPRPGEIEQCVGYAWRTPSFNSSGGKRRRTKASRNQTIIDTWASRGKLSQLNFFYVDSSHQQLVSKIRHMK